MSDDPTRIDSECAVCGGPLGPMPPFDLQVEKTVLGDDTDCRFFLCGSECLNDAVRRAGHDDFEDHLRELAEDHVMRQEA